jgi:uncharacterized membrane protein YjdF
MGIRICQSRVGIYSCTTGVDMAAWLQDLIPATLIVIALASLSAAYNLADGTKIYFQHQLFCAI